MEKVKNSVKLIGHVGADPEIKNLANDKKLARVSIGVNESFKKKPGAEAGKTQWFNLVFWNGKTDLLEDKVFKGTAVAIEGRLVTNCYTDKKGETRYSTEIVVNTLELATS
jgi:single-strand DNA-binding protein